MRLKKQKGREILKKLKMTTIYMIVSAIFLTSCVFYYGGRFIYYYSVSKGKIVQTSSNLNEILTQPVNLVVEGDGLQVDGKKYVYRGEPSDNYVYYSGMLWRMMSIDEEGNIKMISDETLSVIPWGYETNDYETSIIRGYLNPQEGKENTGIVYALLEEPEKYLVPTKMCADKIAEPTEILGCEIAVEDYVGLMNVNEYFFANGVDSYLNTKTQQWTLTAKADDNTIFYVHTLGGIGNNTESTTDKYSYGVRAVITLKANTEITGGNGLEVNPYQITPLMDNEKSYALNEMKIGSHFAYENEIWRIVGFEEGKTKAIMMDVIKDEVGMPIKKAYSNKSAVYSLSKGSLGHYLNNEYVKGFEHPEYLASGTFYIGEFSNDTAYAMDKVKGKTIEAKVGLPQIYDIYTTNTLESDEYTSEIAYWTGNYKKSSELLTWVMRSGDWLFGDFATNEYAVRPVIYLNENIQVVTGEGTMEAPFEIMGVNE